MAVLCLSGVRKTGVAMVVKHFSRFQVFSDFFSY